MGYVFTHIPPSELAWKILRIQGELTVSQPHQPVGTVCSPVNFQTYNKIIAAYEAKTGQKLEVTRTSREVLAEKASKGDLNAFLLHEWDIRGATVGTPLTNDLYPDWNPKSVIDAIA